ncbi:hypothetical protein [Bacillus sp. T3]|uniref:hypothetical protein n=1 Tax=Bacillus sp. T3 TaxID=467262 RepID=UPI00298177B4|nr:hypothetical protein [Bacillus sp. T3]
MKGKGVYIAISALLGTLTALLHSYLALIIFFGYVWLLYRYKPFSKPHYFVIVLTFPLYVIVAITTDINNKTDLNGTEERLAITIFEWETDGDLLQITGEDQQTKEKLLIRYYITSMNEKM